MKKYFKSANRIFKNNDKEESTLSEQIWQKLFLKGFVMLQNKMHSNSVEMKIPKMLSER